MRYPGSRPALRGMCGIALAALILSAATEPAAIAQPVYRITLDRPRTPGTHFTMSTLYTLHQSMSLSTRGAVLQRTDSSYDVWMDLDAIVLDSSALNLTVRRCEKVLPDKQVVRLLEPGAQFSFHPSSSTQRIVPLGAVADSSVFELIDDAFPGTTRNLADDIIGTPVPQRVGASWKINRGMVAAALAGEAGLVVKEKDVEATATLEHVRPKGSDSIMTVQANLSLKKFEIPNISDYTVKDARANILLSGDFPLDTNKGVGATRMTMIVGVTASSKPRKGEPPLTLAMQVTRIVSTSYEYP